MRTMKTNKKPNTVLEDLCLLLKKDFKYDGIDYDYNTSHHCDTNCQLPTIKIVGLSSLGH